MMLINPTMKVSEAARLAAAMNARLIARPGRLEIENLPDLESSRFGRGECVSHGAALPVLMNLFKCGSNGLVASFSSASHTGNRHGFDVYRAHQEQQGGRHD